jgi:hypothetical protein
LQLQPNLKQIKAKTELRLNCLAYSKNWEGFFLALSQGFPGVNNSSKILQSALLESHPRYICGYPPQGRKELSKEEARGE